MGGKTEKQTHIQESDYLKIQELSYEDTLQVLSQQQSTSGLAQQTEQQRATQQQGGGGVDAGAVAVGAIFGPIGAGIGALFGGTKWNQVVDVDDSGYQYVKDWMQTKWDRARYAIGIKELGINTNTYAATSNFVSTLWSVPGEVRKVSLLVEQQIPELLKQLDPVKQWIEYYISVDDQTWHQIAPVSSTPSTRQSGTQIPVIYNINSPLPEEERSIVQGYIDTEAPIREVRFMAILTRPGDEDYEQLTPVLKKYKLKLSVNRGII